MGTQNQTLTALLLFLLLALFKGDLFCFYIVFLSYSVLHMFFGM